MGGCCDGPTAGAAAKGCPAPKAPAPQAGAGAEADGVRTAVASHYGGVVAAPKAGDDAAAGCCAPGLGCGGAARPEMSLSMGYSAEEVAAVPEGANLGLGCGNPSAHARLREGDTVLDLGSGAGFDAFLARRKVGATGQVIGVDMTPAMLAKSRELARKKGYANCSFRLGEIEHLPVADGSVDLIISNCVINLTPEKGQVFRECFRVLKPGGRLCISDVVTRGERPITVAGDLEGGAYTEEEGICACVTGAVSAADLEELLEDALFQDVSIAINEHSTTFIKDWLPGSGSEKVVASAIIEAVKSKHAAGKCC